MAAPHRLTLRSLSFPQKLLVLTILATVGLGYLAALANLFSQVAGADGNQTVSLAEFGSVARERGLSALMGEIENSLGKDDVIRRYHGSGAGVTRLEAALNGTMKEKISEQLGSDGQIDDATGKLAEELRQTLIAFSKLDRPLRKQAYEDGVPTNDEGAVDWAAFELVVNKKVNKKDAKIQPLITETLSEYCVGCHKPGGDSQAQSMPLETLEQVERYCVEDRGMSYPQLAMTTHVHLLGFSVLFAMTGFIFSLTSFPTVIRAIFTPWTLAFQIGEIACWWLAKSHVGFAVAIFYLGGLVGIGLLVQIGGSLIDLFARPSSPDA